MPTPECLGVKGTLLLRLPNGICENHRTSFEGQKKPPFFHEASERDRTAVPSRKCGRGTQVWGPQSRLKLVDDPLLRKPIKSVAAPKTSGDAAARVFRGHALIPAVGAHRLCARAASRAPRHQADRAFSGDEIDDAAVRRKGKISTIEEVTA
jgi:hypothetical protein